MNQRNNKLLLKQSSVKPVSLQAILLFFLLHIVVALFIREYEVIADIYCIAVIIIGICLAISTKRLDKIAYVCAYIAGAEVLWRMSKGAVFWEIGKYGTIAILAIALLKMKRPKIPVLMLFYFLLLLPSALITAQEETSSVAREQVSFYLSGPLAILMCAWFFSSLKITSNVFQRLLLAFLAPVFGIASLTFYGILNATNIVFTTESNFATSGGFGPNQVSVSLGLGALFAFYFLLIPEKPFATKTFFTGALLILASLSLITFSRGGIVLLLSCIFVSAVFLLRSQGKKAGIYVIVLAAGIATSLLFPLINDYTGGMLGKRYTEETTTRRGDLAEEEVALWTENPVFGVGIGQMRHLRPEENKDIAAHTEFTRALAEHGLFGLLALLLLLFTAIKNVLYAENSLSRVFKASFVCWVLLFMLANALRTVAPALMFGLSFSVFLMNERGNLPNLNSAVIKDRLNKFKLRQSA